MSIGMKRGWRVVGAEATGWGEYLLVVERGGDVDDVETVAIEAWDGASRRGHEPADPAVRVLGTCPADLAAWLADDEGVYAAGMAALYGVAA